jgi:hypothetical protein
LLGLLANIENGNEGNNGSEDNHDCQDCDKGFPEKGLNALFAVIAQVSQGFDAPKDHIGADYQSEQWNHVRPPDFIIAESDGLIARQKFVL